MHEMTDIDIIPETGAKLSAAGLKHKFAAMGLTLTAGKGADG